MEELILPAPHPSTLEEDDFLAQCELSFGRATGPGGQHRNRVETAVVFVHKPTGLEAGASERRRQFDNRIAAIKRLRLKVAVRARTTVDPERYRPSKLWASRRQGKQMSINPEHRDYPALLAEALDLLFARRYDVAGTAGILGISMSQLVKLIRHQRDAHRWMNEGRARCGLQELR